MNSFARVAFVEGWGEKEARPSPWATAIGRDEEDIWCRKTEGGRRLGEVGFVVLVVEVEVDGVGDGESEMPTIQTLASYCSDSLRSKLGHVSAPGMRSLSLERTWQPLQTPSVNVSGRLKNVANSSRVGGWNRMLLAQPWPAPRTSPKEKPPHNARPRKVASETRPDMMSVMCTSKAVKPALWNANAISAWPFVPWSRRMATRGFVVGRR